MTMIISCRFESITCSEVIAIMEVDTFRESSALKLEDDLVYLQPLGGAPTVSEAGLFFPH
jgi:hypothetical protein